MAIPIAYNLRKPVGFAKTTTIMTALGIALTVAVLLAMLALCQRSSNCLRIHRESAAGAG